MQTLNIFTNMGVGIIFGLKTTMLVPNLVILGNNLFQTSLDHLTEFWNNYHKLKRKVKARNLVDYSVNRMTT